MHGSPSDLASHRRDDESSLVVYSTTWCGYCRVLKRQLDEHAIAYVEIDIDTRPDAADFVMSINGGNATVPTVVFADGSTLTNPSLAAVRARLDHLDGLAS